MFGLKKLRKDIEEIKNYQNSTVELIKMLAKEAGIVFEVLSERNGVRVYYVTKRTNR